MTTLHARARSDEERRRVVPAVRRAASAGRAIRRMEPPLGRPTRTLEIRFSGVGLTVGGIFLAASLLPSLLPRFAVVQGVISGVSLVVGYGLGTAVSAACASPTHRSCPSCPAPIPTSRPS